MATTHCDTDHKGSINRTTPSLLALPGEIRNKIYQHVLDAGPNGLGFNFAWHPKAYSVDEQGSRRRRILIRPRAAPPARIEDTYDSFNQLKYVCKQLYIETAHLELEYNTLAFRSDVFGGILRGRVRSSPVRQLRMFCSAISNSRLDRCKGINLEVEEGFFDGDVTGVKKYLTQPDIDHYTHVAQFCNAHPSIPVRYILLQFHMDDLWRTCALVFIIQGVTLNLVLRGRDLTFLVPPDYQDLIPNNAKLRYGHDCRSWQAENLRFFAVWNNNDNMAPWLVPTLEIDEKVVRERFEALKRYNILTNEREGGTDMWVKYIREWVTEGF